MLRRFGRSLTWLLLLTLATVSQAVDFYISPSGTDSGNCQSQGSPCKTFSYVLSDPTPNFSAGDTLYLADGVYESGTTGLIGSTDLPSGNSTADMTEVIGTNGAGNVRYAGQLTLGSNSTKLSYVKIQGLLFSTGDTSECGLKMFNTNYIYIKECGVRSFEDAWKGSLSMGASGSDHGNGNTNILIEDVWIWGKNKDQLHVFCSNSVVARRVIARHNGCDGAVYCVGGSAQTYVVGDYNSNSVSFQNVFTLDSLKSNSRRSGDFHHINNSGACHNGNAYDDSTDNISQYGCVSLNAGHHGFLMDTSTNDLKDPTYTFENCVSWNTRNENDNNSNLATGTSQSNGVAVFRNLTGGLSFGTAENFNMGSLGSETRQDLLAHSNGASSDWNFDKDVTNSAYWPDGFKSGFSCSGNCSSTNPTTAAPTYSEPCLKYPMRIEANSFCDGSGVGGSDIGANVVAYGTDGKFYGEAGYATKGTFGDLWPYPNETLIKNQMCADDPQGRGLCADWVSEANTGKTISEYMWEQLGNTCPPEICQGVAACADGIDNDGDGSIDLADSNCVDANDTSESSCGDNDQEGTAEVCDGTDLPLTLCSSVTPSGSSVPYDTGNLACESDCSAYDESACRWTCGDGVDASNPLEECDGADLSGQSCTSLGLGTGTLDCYDPAGGTCVQTTGNKDTCDSNDCTFDTTGCSVAESTRVTDGLVALYEFNAVGGQLIEDTANSYDLTINEQSGYSWLPEGALDITSAIMATSGAAPSALYTALFATDELSVEAWVKPLNTTQGGPRRILALSQDYLSQNFVFGQEGSTYEMRLRTTGKNDPSGKPELFGSTVTAAGEFNHVVFTRSSAGVETFYVDSDGGGANHSTATQTETGTFDNGVTYDWDTSHVLRLGNESGQDRSWRGEIHLLAIYSKDLSLAEVQQNFNAGPNGVSSSTCGDDTKDAGEECDGTDLDGETCETQTGYTEGTLACTDQCMFDTSGCGLGTIVEGVSMEGITFD